MTNKPIVCAGLLALACVYASAQAQQALVTPTPRPVVEGIADALATHPVVCLGEGTHRGVHDFELRVALLRDPRIQALVNDVVVEFGNARYQPLIDRFVNGENVSETDLRRVWEDTVPADTVADSPVYERLYRAVRDINAGLPPARRLRVLLGDPPIDWNAVQSAADIEAWDERRDPHAVDVIRREVLEKGRRALVVYGSWHCAAKNDKTNFSTADSLRALLDRRSPGAVFAVHTFGRDDADPRVLEPTIASWGPMMFARLATTTLGAVDWSAVNALDGRVERVAGVRAVVPRSAWRARSLAEQYDAVIYLAPPSALTIARLTPERCADAQYMRMRTQRMALALGIGPEGTADDPIGQLRRYCETERQGR